MSAHAWPCPAAVGHTTCLCEPGRHKGDPRPIGEPALALVAVLAILGTYLFLVGALS